MTVDPRVQANDNGSVRTRATTDVFGYQDFREFLRAYYLRRKAEQKGFSFRGFSRRVGLRSPNYLKLVMDGDRNLTPELAHRFAEACGLSGEAVAYFCILVAFNQAKSAQIREQQYAMLKRFRRYRATHRLDISQDAYHSEWYIPAIRELVAHHEFSEDPKWIAKRLWPSITPQQAKTALSVLGELGMLVRDREGRLTQSETLVQTPDRPLGHHVVQFHRTMLQRAAEALDHVSRDEREIGALTLCIDEQQLKDLKIELRSYRRQLLQRYQAGERAQRVVQVNFQMFPISRKE